MFRSLSRILAVVLTLFVIGCREGTSAPITQTHLGSTGVTVTLLAPDEKGHYRYYVSDQIGSRLDRFLGPAQVASSVQPQVTDEGSGRYRVTWGAGVGAAYSLIDTKHRKVISDTNQANHEQQF